MSDLLQTLQDPHARHAMLVHLPIIFGALGFIPAIALLINKARNHWLRGTVVVWFVLASIGAGLAAGAGEDAAEGVEHASPALSATEEHALEEHEELGENGWIWPLIPAVLVLVTLVPRPPVRLAAAGLAAVASLGVAGWIATTAHAGGELVYAYGLGVPERGATPSSTAERTREHDEDDDD